MGVFVTFDGPNGAGKSTVLRVVRDRLAQAGMPVYATMEPTSSSLGVFLRSAESFCRGRALACLVAADRYSHIDSEVLPALLEGKVVLSDRYVESSLVLQQLDGVDAEFIWSINSQIEVPDISVIVTASPETLDRRLAKRSCRSWFEKHYSRADEVRLYAEAAGILGERGFNVLLLENDVTPADENAERVVRQVLAMRGKQA